MTIQRHLSRLWKSLATWWLDQLEMALPIANRYATADRQPMRLVVRTEEKAVSIALLNQADEVLFIEHTDWLSYTREMFDRCLSAAERLARPRGFSVSLVLTQAIGRSLMIPRAARAQAEDIIRAHIRRKTPLRLDDIFLGFVVRMARDGCLEVRYLVTPRSFLDKLLQRLAIQSTEVSTLENQPDGAVPAVIVPLTPTQRPAAQWCRRVAFGLATVMLASAALSFGSIVIRQELALQQIEQDLADLTRTASSTADKSQAIYEMASDLTRFADLQDLPGALRIWEDLATILPLSTYLTEITISDYTVQISGFSASATALIQAIEGSAFLHGAVLTAPVTRGQDTDKERFSIKASLRRPRATAEEREKG